MGELIGKIITLIVWGVIAFNWAQPFTDASLAKGLHYTGLGLIAAHVVETLVFWSKIQASNNVLVNALQTFVFGYAHVAFMDKKA